MVSSKSTRTFVICRYRSNRIKVVEFSQAFSLGCNTELLNKAANPSPESGETERTGSPKTLERALLNVKVLHLLSMQCFSASSFEYSDKSLLALLRTSLASHAMA